MLIDDTINNQLQDINDNNNYDKNEDDMIIYTFISLLPLINHEDIAIRDTLDWIQRENHPII